MDQQSPDEREDPTDSTGEAAPGPDPDPDFYRRAMRRLPRWIALVTAIALPFVWWRGGGLWAASFLVGAIGGYWNYVAICRFAERLSKTAVQTGRGRRSNVRSILRLLFIAAAAFVIIRFTHINLAAAFMGLFTPVAAVTVEILYELASPQS